MADTFRHIFIFLACVLTSLFTAGAQRWKLYSSFDNTPVKIIDTPDKTYFLAHQQFYDKTQQGYNFPTLALFEYDKSHPTSGIQPLISGGYMSGSDIRLAEYSPAGGYLLIGYQSGLIDILGTDGAVTSIDALKRISLPGGSIINSVTFDPASGDAWVATDGGFLHIDAATRNVAKVASLDRPLNWVGQAGERLIAVSEGKLYESPTLAPRSMSDFTPITDAGNVLALMPLSDKEFACMSGKPGEQNRIMSFRHDGAHWNATSLGIDWFYALDDDKYVTHRYEPSIVTNREGYLIYSPYNAWQLSPDNTGATLRNLPFSNMTLPIGSWDMRNFWSYEDRGKFRRHHASYDGLTIDTSTGWELVGEAIRPNAPASFISTYLNYSPAFGLLTVNHGQTYEFINNSKQTPVLLSGKKDNDWTVYSQLYNIPRSVEQNPELARIFNNVSTWFPVSDPQGLAVDPLNPDWVSCGSMFGGIFFMDLSDPKKDVIHFGAPNDYFNTFPGFVPTTPLQTWRTFSLFSNPEFDAEGRMWAFCANPFDASGQTEPKVNVKFMTAEQRKAFYDAAPENYASLKSWTTIGLPLERCGSWDRLILCGKHLKNKNRVFAFTSGSENTLIILDHHGHPDDTAQIDFRTVIHLENEKGWRIRLRYLSSVAEDPNTGDIIIASLDGLFVIEADAKEKEGVIRGRHLTLRGGSTGDIVPTEAHIFKVIFDDEGRLWIGTRNMGVVGVNKDRTEVIARYSTSNSPIPSDWVTGLGWNPETRSLMISTDRGLAEVFPDLPSNASGVVPPQLSMTIVRPGYNGAVEIRNLSANLTIIIKDAEGKEVRRLDNGSATIAEWDLRDRDDNPLPSGIYTINIANIASLELTVMR